MRIKKLKIPQYGLILFLLGITNTTIQLMVSGSWEAPLWGCNLASMIAGLAIWKNKTNITAAIFFTSLLYQSPVLVDFIRSYLGYMTEIDFSEYLNSPLFTIVISILSHIALIPFCLIAIWNKEFSYKTVLYGYAVFLSGFSISRLLGDRFENINCSYMPCGVDYIDATTSITYFLSMILAYFLILPIMVLVWNFILNNIYE